MTDTAPRPLVTFALFAYNQEKFIREAVEGAFAQTYEPLEIILSDDCSSDRTFEIMRQMAAEYRGPHQVRVRQSEVNRGVLAHVLSVARDARGKLFVVAAGDDISLPHRAEVIARSFDAGVCALSSDDIIIDDEGNERDWGGERTERLDAWHRRIPTWIHGATAAYRTDFLKQLPLPDSAIFFEDAVFADVIDLIGEKTIRLRSPLVKYRFHQGNLSNRRADKSSVDVVEAKAMQRWSRARDAKRYSVMVADSSEWRDQKRSAVAKRLRGELHYLSSISDWKRNGLQSRMRLLYYGFRYGNPRASLSRLFGERAFKALRTMRSIVRHHQS